MKVSFKTIVEYINTKCLLHPQIHEFEYNDVYKKLKEKQHNYAMVFLTDLPTTINGSNVNINFNLIVMDKLIHDNTNELNVKSNTLQILLDIIGILTDESIDGFQINTDSINLTPFSDSFLDDVAGWKAEITILTTENYDACSSFKTNL